MAQFEISRRKTAKAEGGYSNRPVTQDRGGETWRGASRVRHPELPIWPIIDGYKGRPDFPACLDSDPELPGMMVAFYHDEFWKPIAGDAIPEQRVADHVYDVAVNSGPETAVRYLQSSLNLLNRNQQLYHDVPVDGKMGPGTLGALSTCLAKRPLALLLTDMVMAQGCHMRQLMLTDPVQEENLGGWYARLDITVNP